MRNIDRIYRKRVALSLISISAVQNNDILTITIEDEGSQINQENLENIFSMFITDKKIGNALNIGDTYKIIKAHLGDISVRGKEIKGSIFSINLPIKKDF